MSLLARAVKLAPLALLKLNRKLPLPSTTAFVSRGAATTLKRRTCRGDQFVDDILTTGIDL